jgi:hypothetical protein
LGVVGVVVLAVLHHALAQFLVPVVVVVQVKAVVPPVLLELVGVSSFWSLNKWLDTQP